ncbi:hypothetical protein [Actinoplanes sp. DH11]|uniref:hypothetical protein n=1 Tax=Actinoplanes sp. DH11 TaxID=2857011 RepID=UPI001E42282E|nr:hypothetical protein [Actinoplanes sp. DH11]
MTLQFVAFSQRGAGARPTELRTAGRRQVRISVKVHAEYGGDVPARDDDPVAVLLSLYGPGDVVGVDPARIIRRLPGPGVPAMEPNYLAGIEFDDPDLPWLFGFDVDGRPLPWVMLVVLPDDGSTPVQTRAGAPNPVVSCAGARLPDPARAGDWAHVQVGADEDRARQVLRAAPHDRDVVRSRLLAPVRLRPESGYLACLVPVFEDGRLAGLGRDPAGSSAVWDRSATVTLPVYDHWSFRTAPAGDFRLLAGRLRRAPDTGGALGRRSVAVDPVAARLQPPGTAPLFAGRVLAVPTALARHDHAADDGPIPELAARLRELLDRTATGPGGDPVVGPPVYGQWHAGSAPPPAWLDELNLNPAERIGAGLGAQVVQRHQEELMAEAWTQLHTVQQANQRIGWGQLGAVVADPIHRRLSQLPGEEVMAIVSPVLGRVRDADGTGTVLAGLAADGIPPAVLSPTFARVAARVSRTAAAGRVPVRPMVTTIIAGIADKPDTSHVSDRADLAAGMPVGMSVLSAPAGPRERVLDALRPDTAYTAMLSWANPITEAADRLSQRTPLDRIHAEPRFGSPAVERLRALNQDWVLGGAGTLTPNSVCLLSANRRFVEAFLAGANHEMVRELRWRGFPADPRATCFRRFWAGGPDHPPLTAWRDRLGDNTVDDVDQAVLVIKGDLFRRYPSIIVTAERIPQVPGGLNTAAEVFRGRLDPDVTYAAIAIAADELTKPGWHISLTLPPQEPRFGLRATDTGTAEPDLISAVADRLGTTSADVAATLYQPPFRVLLPADEYLLGGEGRA